MPRYKLSINTHNHNCSIVTGNVTFDTAYILGCWLRSQHDVDVDMFVERIRDGNWILSAEFSSDGVALY
jgi:hypothetical protein